MQLFAAAVPPGGQYGGCPCTLNVYGVDAITSACCPVWSSLPPSFTKSRTDRIMSFAARDAPDAPGAPGSRMT